MGKADESVAFGFNHTTGFKALQREASPDNLNSSFAQNLDVFSFLSFFLFCLKQVNRVVKHSDEKCFHIQLF